MWGTFSNEVMFALNDVCIWIIYVYIASFIRLFCKRAIYKRLYSAKETNSGVPLATR